MKLYEPGPGAFDLKVDILSLDNVVSTVIMLAFLGTEPFFDFNRLCPGLLASEILVDSAL